MASRQTRPDPLAPPAPLASAGGVGVGMPERWVGGAPITGQLDVWIAEGLPARCHVCQAVLKFVWAGESTDGWICPNYGETCLTSVWLSDLIRSSDGQAVRCDCTPGWDPHLVGDVAHLNGVCRLRVRDRIALPAHQLDFGVDGANP